MSLSAALCPWSLFVKAKTVCPALWAICFRLPNQAEDLNLGSWKAKASKQILLSNMEAEGKQSSAEKMPPPPIPGENKDEATPSPQPDMSKQDKVNIEREQEQKLKAKYPQVNRPMPVGGGAGGGGHSAFLQKRLAKGQKYFDSGDYNMAKQKGPRGAMGRLAIPVLAQPPTGDTIPTPDTVPARKTSIIQPLHDHSQSMHLASDPAHAGGPTPTPPAPGQPMPNPAITKLASWVTSGYMLHIKCIILTIKPLPPHPSPLHWIILLHRKTF